MLIVVTAHCEIFSVRRCAKSGVADSGRCGSRNLGSAGSLSSSALCWGFAMVSAISQGSDFRGSWYSRREDSKKSNELKKRVLITVAFGVSGGGGQCVAKEVCRQTSADGSKLVFRHGMRR